MAAKSAAVSLFGRAFAGMNTGSGGKGTPVEEGSGRNLSSAKSLRSAAPMPAATWSALLDSASKFLAFATRLGTALRGG